MRTPLKLLIAALLAGSGAQIAAAAERPAEVSTPVQEVDVALDLAQVVRVPVETQMLVIGNPAVADASVQANGVLIITGKSYGRTNVLVLDGEGETVREMMVNVGGRRNGTVTVHRGVQRETYSCTPNCEQTITPGDTGQFFDTASTQLGTRNTAAQGPR